VNASSNGDPTPSTSPEGGQSELHRFLQDHPSNDNCPFRKSYNKNERRQGFNRAEIVDYLVVYNHHNDPVNVFSGDPVDIYIKARFHERVEFPLMGIAVKTIDGVLIYGFNSFYTQQEIPEAHEGDIVIGKFSLNLKLRKGDYFFDFGVDLKESEDSSNYVNLDRRCAAMHLEIIERNSFFGLADFEADFDPITPVA